MEMKRSKEKVSEKVTELTPRLSKSTVLSGRGKQSLDGGLLTSLDNPYFPHMYVDKRNGETSKWTGKRFWN